MVLAVPSAPTNNKYEHCLGSGWLAGLLAGQCKYEGTEAKEAMATTMSREVDCGYLVGKLAESDGKRVPA